MTYWQFHFFFNLPLLLGTIALAWGHISRADAVAAAATATIAFVFTTPWDNWAIQRGIWGFPDSRISGKIFVCPVEEYAFFIIQTLQVCTWTIFLRASLPAEWMNSRSAPRWEIAGLLLLAWAIAGACRFQHPRKWNYTWHLFFWMAPVVALQWAAGGFFMNNLFLVLLSVLPICVILSLFDLVAIRHGIWFFDESQTLGIKIAGVLPIEEAAFFAVTSLLVTQSFLLFV